MATAKKTSAKTAAKKPATRAKAKTTTKAAAKPAAKTAAKAPAKKPAAKTAAKAPAKKPAAKTTAKAPAKKPAAKAAAKTPAKKPAAAKTAAKKPAAKEAAGAASKATEAVARKSALGYRVNEHIVYPAHGVGQIVEISSQEIAGMQLELFVINFDKEKMVLRVPLDKAKQIGMRKLADADTLDGAIKTLRGRARVKRTMWSRRAQEYEAKINSGDLIAIAEVVRDLFRNENQPEQSYSERQLYEAALERMAREVATIRKVTEDEAIVELEAILAQTTGGARRRNEPDAA
jgi:CarD family transcriptional regulator